MKKVKKNHHQKNDQKSIKIGQKREISLQDEKREKRAGEIGKKKSRFSLEKSHFSFKNVKIDMGFYLHFCTFQKTETRKIEKNTIFDEKSIKMSFVR